MKTTTGLDRRTRTQHANCDAWIADGWKMAEYEDEAAFQSIEIKYGAEVAEHGVHIENVKARGHSALQHLKHVEQNLGELHFDPAEHLKQIAHGKADLACAAILLCLNATLAVLLLLAVAPAPLTIPLACLVLVTALPIEEFFLAHSEKAELREGIFLTAAIAALAAQFWLGALRGIFLTALAPIDAGPVTHALKTAGPILRWTLGILATVSECICGFKIFQARTALLSPTARAVGERAKVTAQLAHLHTTMEATKVEPDVRRREIGVRQYLASKAGAERRHQANHLRRALTGALIALLVIIILLFFLGSNSYGAVPAAGRNVIALVDLTKSVTDESFQADIDGVSSLIPQLQAGDRFLVVDITDSFGNTAVVLDRRMPNTSGYMGLTISAERETLASEWKTISAGLSAKHTFLHTDILGSLTFLSYITALSNSKTFIFIFSDGRRTRLRDTSRVRFSSTV